VRAPSNIAFVKYWGKHGRQYPINPSVSMTLEECVTECRVDYHYGASSFCLDAYKFDGRDNEAFRARFEKYFQGIADVFPLINKLNLSIESRNTFPHSAGIASSASAFAALGTALAELQAIVDGKDKFLETTASQLARLGSGSACRSITGPYMMWGACDEAGSTDENAIALTDVHHDFAAMKDCVLLIDTAPKAVSSSQGHTLMEAHPFRTSRIQQAKDHTHLLIKAMREGDMEQFGHVVENEALTLHALMMSSSEPFVLLEDNSLKVVEKIRDIRKTEHLPVYFTIDAGPNIHLIYPEAYADKVEAFVEAELLSLCEDGKHIKDRCGGGVHVSRD